MTKNEIESCVELVRTKNDNGAYEKLMAQFRPLISKFAYKNDPMHYEDAMQDGYLGLWQAALKWAPGENASFTTYAYSYIWGSIMSGLRDRRPIAFGGARSTPSKKLLEDPVFMAMNNPRSIDSILCANPNISSFGDGGKGVSDTETWLLAEQAMERITEILDSLDPGNDESEQSVKLRRKLLFTKLYLGIPDGARWTREQIRKAYGLSKRQLDSILASGLNLLRKDRELRNIRYSVYAG